jgi:phage shock protein E
MRLFPKSAEVSRVKARRGVHCVVAVIVSLVLTAPAIAERVEPTKAFDLVADGAVLLDVRSESEHASAHLPGSQHIPHTEIGMRIEDVGASPETPIVVYCRSGRRAAQAIETLKERGFLKIYNAGGFEDLLSTWCSRSEKPSPPCAMLSQ